jgi:hypothetical protein
MKRRISRFVTVATLAALMTLFSVGRAATAAVEVGPFKASGGGMNVTFYGTWVDRHHMTDIGVTICENGGGLNSNEATAALEVSLQNTTTGAITYQRAPARLKVPGGQASDICAVTPYPGWSLGYSQVIRAVRLQFWGDEAPSDVWATGWAYNKCLTTC